MDTGQREYYSSMWDYIIHITEILFLIQVTVLKRVGKKNLHTVWIGNQNRRALDQHSL